MDDQVRVRSVHGEHVGKSRDGQAEVGARIFAPDGVQVRAIATVDFDRLQESGRLESCPVKNDVERMVVAVFRHDAIVDDLADRRPHDTDIVPLKGAKPVSVIPQDPFRAHRRSRDRRVAQIGPRGDPGFDPRLERGPQDVVALRDRGLRRGVIRVERDAVEQSRPLHHQHRRTVPEEIGRKFRHEPSRPVRDGVMKFRCRQKPCGGAREDRDGFRNRSCFRRELAGACAGADHADILPGKIDGMIPSCGMERGTGETRAACDIGQGGAVELAHREDDEVVRLPFLVSAVIDRKRPGHRRLVPPRGLDLAPEQDMLVDRLRACDTLQIFEDVWLLAEIFRPDVRRTGVAVDIAVDVDTTARIVVFKPCAAEIDILFVEREGNAGLLEADCGNDAALATTHDRDAERAVRRDPVLVPARSAKIPAVKHHFFGDQGYVRLDILSDRPCGDAMERVEGDRRRGSPARAEGGEGVPANIDDLVLLGLGDVAPELAEDRRRLPFGPQEGEIACQMGGRHQENRKIGSAIDPFVEFRVDIYVL